MRIIGGKDYYDSALKYGRDESIVFVRHKKKEIKEDELPHKRPLILRNISATLIQVYFCGKVYYGIRLWSDMTGNKDLICWDFQTFEEIWNKYLKSKTIYRLETFKEYFEGSGSDKYSDILIEKGITIAVLEQFKVEGLNKWKIDGFDLRKYEFFRVKDAFTAYQEIYAWVSGVLSNNNTAPQITDDRVKIEKHGFDYKTSFRNVK